MADKLSRFTVGVDILRDQPIEPGIKCVPLDFCWWILGPADQVGQAGLPGMNPVLIQPIAVTDQDAFPNSDQRRKGVLGTMGVDHEIGDYRTGHYPEPVELAVVFPWGFVNMVAPGSMCLFADGLVMRVDCFGGPVDNILDGSKADTDAQHRGAKRLDSLSTDPLNAADLGYKGTKSWAKAGSKSFWCISFTGFPAVAALTPVEDEMTDGHRNFRQLDVLRGVVRT